MLKVVLKKLQTKTSMARPELNQLWLAIDRAKTKHFIAEENQIGVKIAPSFVEEELEEGKSNRKYVPIHSLKAKNVLIVLKKQKYCNCHYKKQNKKQQAKQKAKRLKEHDKSDTE